MVYTFPAFTVLSLGQALGIMYIQVKSWKSIYMVQKLKSTFYSTGLKYVCLSQIRTLFHHGYVIRRDVIIIM